MSDEPNFDPVKLRALILSIAAVWMTVDDIQREVTAIRERTGEKPAHVPIQLVQQTLNQLIEQGSMVEKKDPGKPIGYRLVRQAVVTRRAKVLELLALESDNADLEPKLIERSGATSVDLDELVAQNLITRKTGDFGSLISIPQKVSVEIMQRGSEAVVGATLPHDADDKAVGDDFAAKAVKKASEFEERAKKAELGFQRLQSWLASNGIHDIDGIVEPPPAKRERDTFDHTETRQVDAAERSQILTEILGLEERRALVQLQLDGAKSRASADFKAIDAELGTLKSFAQSSERVVAVKAYKDIDWKGNCVLIKAVADDRVLERLPIPKGAQKPIPGTDKEAAKANGVAEAPPAEASPPDPRPPFVDLKAAVLDVLRPAELGLIQETIAERIRASYSGVPDALEGLLKIQLHQLVRSKEITRVVKTGIYQLATPEPAQAEPSDAKPSSEPGPFADPERKKKGKASDDAHA